MKRSKSNQGPEPIAIVGMACRFPGAANLSEFWRLLEAGGNAVTEGVPGSGIGRVGALFPDDTGQIEACRFGAYLDELDRFDAAFFRISPVEAQLLDPAATPDSGDELAGARGCWHRSGGAAGQPHWRVCGHQQQRTTAD